MDTLQAVLSSMKETIGSRHEAADILQKVAELGRSGNFPSDVTCEQLGRALERIVLNSQEEDPFLKVMAGWRAAENERNQESLEFLR